MKDSKFDLNDLIEIKKIYILFFICNDIIIIIEKKKERKQDREKKRESEKENQNQQNR